MSNSFPLVSILMPVFNGMPYLPEAVESILGQTLSDFEFIIVNDGSSDDSLDYLNSINDSRVVLFNNRVNVGLSESLNIGLSKSRGKYIARIDQDDIAVPERIEKQCSFLEANRGIGLLGSGFEVINEEGKFIGIRSMGLEDMEIKWRLMFKNPFLHSSVMLRMEDLRASGLSYPSTMCEDYLLWSKLILHTGSHILGDPLVKYRTHSASDSASRNAEYLEARAKISSGILHRTYGARVTFQVAEFGEWVRSGQVPYSDGFVEAYLALLRMFEKRWNVKLDRAFVHKRLNFLKGKIGRFDYYTDWRIFNYTLNHG